MWARKVFTHAVDLYQDILVKQPIVSFKSPSQFTTKTN